MFLNQLFRLLAGIFELGFLLVLVALFIVGITFITHGYTTIGVLMTVGIVWFVGSAMKDHR